MPPPLAVGRLGLPPCCIACMQERKAELAGTPLPAPQGMACFSQWQGHWASTAACLQSARPRPPSHMGAEWVASGLPSE